MSNGKLHITLIKGLSILFLVSGVFGLSERVSSQTASVSATGTAAPWVIDINPGSGDSNPGKIYVLGDVAVFSAEHASYGKEPWVTDGTADGTVLLKDIVSGTNDGLPFGHFSGVVVNDTLLFVAEDSANGQELWHSDGTPTGTGLFMDINDGVEGSYPAIFANLNGVAYFRANDGINGTELWRSDGTTGGTAMVADARPGSGGITPQSMIAAPGMGRLFFAGFEGLVVRTVADEPWTSDGVSVTRVAVILPGPSGSNPGLFMEAGSMVFFIADNGTHGGELWTTTGSGATMVTDLNPNAADGAIRTVTEYNGDLLFVGDDGIHGLELWRSDGSPGGTQMIKDICSGSCSSSTFTLWWVIHNGLFYFTADDGIHGNELWVSDGTAGGTTMVKDINPGPGDSDPFMLTVVNGLIYFNADDGVHGAELWQSNGTAAGTVLTADLYPGPYWSSSFPSELTAFNNKLLFQARNVNYGYELHAFRTPTGSYTTTVDGDRTYDFPGTAADVVIDGYTVLAGGNTLILELYEQGPANIEGISAGQEYSYRWMMHKPADAWTFEYTTELRLKLSEIPGFGVADPGRLTVHYRPTPGSGAFSALTTSYDSGSGELVARGFTAAGEFMLAGDSDCTQTAVTGVPQSECEALVALYNGTNGPGWANNSNWNTTSAIDTWYGVGVSGGHIVTLDLDSNQLSGSIPTTIGNLTNLTRLDLNSNQLSGSIPAEIGSLTNLRELYLFSNLLSGSIPAAIGNLTNLMMLLLDSNQLSGSIPAEIGNLTNLLYLGLSLNQLTGPIPAEIGNLTNLIYLSLSMNQLSDSIPTTIGNLSNLILLQLSNNRLKGEVPIQFTNLNELSILDIGYNMLTASDPEVKAFLDAKDPDWRSTQSPALSAMPWINFLFLEQEVRR